MFFGNTRNLKVPALKSRMFSIDFTHAVEPDLIVPNCLTQLGPHMEGVQIGFVTVRAFNTYLDQTLGQTLYALPVAIYGERSFADQTRALKKLLDYRQLELVDYRVLGPAWTEDMGLPLALFQTVVVKLAAVKYPLTYTLRSDYFQTGSTFEDLLRWCTQDLIQHLPPDPHRDAPPPPNQIGGPTLLTKCWRSFCDGFLSVFQIKTT